MAQRVWITGIDSTTMEPNEIGHTSRSNVGLVANLVECHHHGSEKLARASGRQRRIRISESIITYTSVCIPNTATGIVNYSRGVPAVQARPFSVPTTIRSPACEALTIFGLPLSTSAAENTAH